jgi:tetratricopeptide (TPR) repeat protein
LETNLKLSPVLYADDRFECRFFLKTKKEAMKKVYIVIVLLLFASVKLWSQSLEEGVRMYHYERYATAAKQLEIWADQHPDDINGWYWLVRACQANQQPDTAAGVLERIPGTLHDQPLYKVINGRILLQKGDTAAARADFLASLGKRRKKDPVILQAVAEANIDLAKGDHAFALQLLEEAVSRSDRNPEIFTAIGDIYRKQYNGSEAYRNYQRAADLDKSDPVPFYKIGKIYQSQNNPEIFMDYYQKAIAADPSFGQVYYQLYYYYYFRDVAKAMENLRQYIAHTDPDTANDLLLADMYYISHQYKDCIAAVGKIIQRDGSVSTPRLYKLLAYSEDALQHPKEAVQNLRKYFEAASDSLYAPEDFELMARSAEQLKQPDEAAIWYEKAFLLSKDTTKKTAIAKRLINYHKTHKQYERQAYWFEQLGVLGAQMSNVDIFSWGIAEYNAADYHKADSVFGVYADKYPDQTFGYYWRARSNAAIDTAMETGIAVPYYEALIKVAEKDTVNANNRKWLIQAYGYIAAYRVNKEKQYNDALSYYDKILQLDPQNADAEKYKGVLEKMMEAGSDTKADVKTPDKGQKN